MMQSQPHIALAAHLLPTLESSPVRVLLIARDEEARDSIAAMLSSYDDLIVEAPSRTGFRDVLAVPDVVLCDAGSPHPEGFAGFDAPVLALIDDRQQAGAALAAGARGVLLRDASPRRIHAALQALSEGMTVVGEGMPAGVVARGEADLFEPLTHRELEVVQLLADGLTNKEVARRLGISDHTVKFHVNGILGKLGVETRTEAVVHAARLGLVAL